jgi:DNA polymerase III delta prime subunit
MEISLLLTLDRREQAALQAALLTHGAPDSLVTMALTGACKITSLDEAQRLRQWLANARAAGERDFDAFNAIERELEKFGV